MLVLLSGRPLVLGESLDNCDALVKVKPSGKLPMSWPRAMEQIPINVGDRDYAPLFSFGFGRSYE